MKHKFFELPTGENVVKFDTYIEDKRIIGVATNATLTLLSKALSLHIDGTFKSTPKKWLQTLIITAEVATGVWGM